MGNDFAMNDQSLSRSFSVRENDRDEFFHSSTYAGAQNTGRIGATANGKSVAERQNLNEKRRFVRGYENASLTSQITAYRERAAKEFERAQLEKLEKSQNSEDTTSKDTETFSIRDTEQREKTKVGGIEKNEPIKAGYRYSEDRKARQESGTYGGSDFRSGERGTTNYKEYTTAAKQNFGQGYTRRSSAMGTGGVPDFGQRFTPDFGRSVEREYGLGKPNNESRGGLSANQNGTNRIGSQGSTISNSQRFTNNNFRMKFGPNT